MIFKHHNRAEHWSRARRRLGICCGLDLDILVSVHSLWLMPRHDDLLAARDVSEYCGKWVYPPGEAPAAAHTVPDAPLGRQ